MSEKNFGRPLPPVRGRQLFKFEEVQNYDLSVFQLYDMMERHYLRKATGSDDEAKQYQTALEDKIKMMLGTLKPMVREDEQEIQTNQSDENEEEVSIIKDLRIIAEYHKKRQVDRTDTIQKLKNDLQEELRQIYITYEHHLLSKELENTKIIKIETPEDVKDTSNSSIEEVEIFLEPTPDKVHTLRTSTYHARKKINQMEDKHKKADKDLKVKTKKLEELDQAIKDRKEELVVKEQELQFKKEQIEEFLKEMQQLENGKISLDVETQTELLIAQYSPATSESEEEENENVEDTTEKYITGQKLLENDFIRHGRKMWTDKEVKNFLKNYKKTNSSQKQQPTPQIDTQKLTTEIVTTIKIIYSSTQDLKEILNEYHNKIMNELESLKNAKNKYATFQNYQEQYRNDMEKQIEKLQSYCDIQTEKLQYNYQELQTNYMEQIRKHISDNIETQFREQTRKWNEIIKTLQTVESHQRITKQTNKQDQKIKKLILIPNDKIEINQVTKVIREEAKKTDKIPEIKNIRKTRNNNIELKSVDNEITNLTEILKGKLDNVEIINPDQRKMKIILLRINNEITEEDLEQELLQKNYLESFKILKKIEVLKSNYNNWVLEAQAADCRKVVKWGKLKLFYEIVKVEFHIRVTRCTNCQELNNHVKSQCDYGTRCANCSERHHTEDCKDKDKKTRCINCIRCNKTDIEHQAYSPKCPIFQKVKQERLREYYSSKFMMTNEYNKNQQNLEMQKSGNQIRRQKETKAGTRYEPTRYPESYRSHEKQNDYGQSEYRRYEKRDSYKEKLRKQREEGKQLQKDREESRREDKIKDRNGEIRRIYIRTFENSSRAHYQYPKQYREAMPPNGR